VANLIEVINLIKEYGQESSLVKALDDVSLEIPKGQFICVMGPSGSGKTTFLHMLGGLDFPTSGDIIIDRNNLSNLKKEPDISIYRRKYIGIVFQFFNLIPSINIQDNIALPLVIDGLSKDYIEEKVSYLLKMVGLENQALKYPHQLSGGQQQRVAIARSLIHQPLILLADEPTGNLDTKTTLEIMELIKNTQKELNQTIVLVTHNPIVSSYADRVIYFKDGKLFDDELVGANRVEAINHISEKLNQISGGVIYDK